MRDALVNDVSTPIDEPTPVQGGQAPAPGHREVPAVSGRRETLVGRAFARLATWSLRFLLVVAATVVLGYLLGQLWVVLLPALLALLLATVLWPPVRALRARGVPAALASSAVLVGAVLVLTTLIIGLAPQVAGQSGQLADQAVAGLAELQQRVQGPPLNLGQEQIGGAIDNGVSELQANAESIVRQALTGAAVAGSLLLTAVLALVLCFFYLKDGPRFVPWVSGLVGARAAPHVAKVAQRSWTTLSGFLRAQALVGLVDASLIGIGLLVLGIPLALPLSMLIFFGAFIPIIGAFVTGALAALVALVANGLTSALIVIGLVLLVQQLDGNVLQPILVGRTVDLHPALVITAVTAGGSLAGIAGAFLAVPIVAVAAVMVRYGRQQLAEHEPEPPPGAAGQRVDDVRR